MSHPTPATLLPSPAVTLGVMGGGQLGRMFCHAAQRMGYRTAVLDADPSSPAGLVSHSHIQAGYEDAEALAQLAEGCQAITTEFENVPAPSLNALAARRPVSPPASAVEIAQDRAREKAFFTRCGVVCAPHAVLATAADCHSADPALFPGILKTARLGYDGKGQVTVSGAANLLAAWTSLGAVPCVLEKKLTLLAELSVVVARGQDGQLVNLPVQRNLHRGGILAVTDVCKENVPNALADVAISATKAIANGLNYVGVLCVEFFVVPGTDGKPTLVVNEMAPRPHNSGHPSMDACDQSQFDLQVRTLAGLPLTQPQQHSAAVMLNLLGDLWPGVGPAAATGDATEPPWDKLLQLPGAHLHLYGKQSAKPGRKMGHVTFTAPTAAEARQTALQAAQLLGIEPWEWPAI